MHGTAFERVVDGGIQPRVESDDLRTDPFLDKRDIFFFCKNKKEPQKMHDTCVILSTI